MKRALLEVIASGITKTPTEVQEYADSTLHSMCIDKSRHVGKFRTFELHRISNKQLKRQTQITKMYEKLGV